MSAEHIGNCSDGGKVSGPGATGATIAALKTQHIDMFSFALIIQQPHVQPGISSWTQTPCSKLVLLRDCILLTHARMCVDQSSWICAHLPEGKFSPKACAKSPDTCLARCLDVSAVGCTGPALKLTLLVPAASIFKLSQLRLHQVMFHLDMIS